MKTSNGICEVELDGQVFNYQNGRLSPIQSLNDSSGNHYLITDLQEGISRVLTVEAPLRYVELMVRRKLQESGEFEEPVTILTHWKKARGKNTTDIFFTAIPTRLTLYYTEQLSESEDTVMVFPVYTLLYNSIRQLKTKKPVALVFQHGRFADLLVASSRRVYYAIRCTAFDASRDQLLALWETVHGEICMVEDEQRFKVTKVYALNWIDSCPLPQWNQDMGMELIPMPADDLFLEQEVLSLSFFTAVKKLSIFESISAFKEKLLFKSFAWASALVILTLTAAFGFLGAGFFLSNRTHELENRTAMLKKQYAQVRSEIPALPSIVDYHSTLNFVKELSVNAKVPSYKQVLFDLAEAMSDGMQLEVLKVNYTPIELQLELFGSINAPFDQAHAGYQKFLNITGQKGYRIIESRFDTVIDSSHILMRMVKKWG